jgi:phosphoribosylformylglycinamidine synthase
MHWRGEQLPFTPRQRAVLAGADHSLKVVYADYLIALSAPFTLEEQQKLQALLLAEPLSLVNDQAGFWLTPRQGTRSAWSSKAEEIAQRAGLAVVWRLECCQFFPTALPLAERQGLAAALADPLLESVYFDAHALQTFFAPLPRQVDPPLPLLTQGLGVLQAANADYGLALSDLDLAYLFDEYQKLARNPTLAEIMMFAQANSEHCRHKIFRSSWQTSSATLPSLFSQIQATTARSPAGVVLAYDDNAAVIAARASQALQVAADGNYYFHTQNQGVVIKVETHNHPTFVEPFAGAATGVGGEIRDEGATGRGGRPKAGLAGFAVADLCLPTVPEAWESPVPTALGRASALTIMREAPLGAAAFNNEFGRPNLLGFFRVFSALVQENANEQKLLGYHKPLMLAGGWGSIFLENLPKKALSPGDLLVVLGGPALRIGLGGGAASSLPSGSNSAALDFASVQRSNPEMQRRCQEVIRRCAEAADNPILSIHDVGAGGLANALPELVEKGGVGARIDFAAIPNAEPSLSAMELWCNEAQERYVLAISPKDLPRFQAFCDAERCPFAVLGEAIAEPIFQAHWEEEPSMPPPVHVPLRLLFGAPPLPLRPLSPVMPLPFSVSEVMDEKSVFQMADLEKLLAAVLRQPTVACKRFLISIGDRSVGGFTARDQNVGPWQTPVADVAVTFSDDFSPSGEAAALGERPLVAAFAPAASARLAVAEALTNLWAANVADFQDIKLSANWMADCPSQDADLYEAVRSISDFCQALGLAIPVGKDSLSMRARWSVAEKTYHSQAPLTVVVSAFAPVANVGETLTPQLAREGGLWFLPLGQWGLGGSIAAQVSGRFFENQAASDIDADSLKRAFAFWQAMRPQVSAYHDVSDGGLWATLCEMAFASRCGLDIAVNSADASALRAWLLAEGVGLVFQVPNVFVNEMKKLAENYQLPLQALGQPNADGLLRLRYQDQVLLEKTRADWQIEWEKVSVAMQRLRDDPACASEEAAAVHFDAPFLFSEIKALDQERCRVPVFQHKKPQVAILREQGSNGQREMAAAFLKAGFTALDVSMADLQAGRQSLRDVQALAVCGGFSYGDVLGAGQGWAKSILFTPQLSDHFSEFFARPDTLTLGVCNGCQMLSALKTLIPGAAHFPLWQRNRSQQFEARWAMVAVKPSTSLWFTPLVGAQLPIVVAHGEGRVREAIADPYLGMQFIDSEGKVTESYPFNPNGSVQGATAVSSVDGRVSILMPHPERAVRRGQFSYWPENLSAFPWQRDDSPWLQIFYQAYRLLA